MKEDFMTYKELEGYIENLPRYTYEYSNLQLHIFYDYGVNEKNQVARPVRQPLFSISLVNAFQIVSPYGYRLIQAKTMEGFNELVSKVLALSRTPIYKR